MKRRTWSNGYTRNVATDLYMQDITYCLWKKHNFSLQSDITIIADDDEDFAFIVSSDCNRYAPKELEMYYVSGMGK